MFSACPDVAPMEAMAQKQLTDFLRLHPVRQGKFTFAQSFGDAGEYQALSYSR
jgi:hypothetical protein